ncbi:ImmA/IrrE family metallo-endopeptidase [Micromonospora sp. NPDC049282]|uniref:ImmA/IrrE family metallo-endopeptidase n=1 Tax=Micromonospora sp. NPDC049282 TaxID=3364269 RepID=UPI003722C04F
MTDAELGLWCASGPEEPARFLASAIVERYNLSPPINIEKLIQDCAELFFEDWPYAGCDALVHGLHQRRPQVFVRQGLHPRRQRLTLAHEYGHIKMGWHYGTVGCQAVASEVSTGPAGTYLEIAPNLDEQEREATRFAGYLLIPDRFIRPLIRSTDMKAVLRGLDRTGVSADAAFMRLRHLLQPGFVFTFTVRGERRTYTSPGTVTPIGTSARRDTQALKRASIDSGQNVVSDRIVEWFRLTEFEAFEPVPGSPSATNLLRSAIAFHEPDAKLQQKILLSINGIVGGSLSADRARTPQQALAILRHKFDGRAEYREIIEHSDFDLYLRRKVEEWAQKRGLL